MEFWWGGGGSLMEDGEHEGDKADYQMNVDIIGHEDGDDNAV